jgi:pilus assembly protein Flp/PilA
MTRSLLTRCLALCNDKRGVAAMEYGLIAAFVAVALIAGLTTLGGNLSGFFTSLAGKFIAVP